MSLTTIVGALLAVVGRPAKADKEDPRFIAGYDAGLNDGRLEAKQLTRSHARLVDHIERLERELALTAGLLAHWRDEAARLARDNRDNREAATRASQELQQTTIFQEAQQQQAQRAQYAAAAQQMQTFEGFCNCVPSRSQVWGAQHGLVQQLNDNRAHGAASRLNEES